MNNGINEWENIVFLAEQVYIGGGTLLIILIVVLLFWASRR